MLLYNRHKRCILQETNRVCGSTVPHSMFQNMNANVKSWKVAMVVQGVKLSLRVGTSSGDLNFNFGQGLETFCPQNVVCR
jgi:hypothetical protein